MGNHVFNIVFLGLVFGDPKRFEATEDFLNKNYLLISKDLYNSQDKDTRYLYSSKSLA